MIEDIRQIAAEAGEAILETYDGPAEIELKEDDSPLTQADRAAHDCIVAALANLTPNIPVLSEESEGIPTEERLGWNRFWLVDPLDGTKEFIARNDEFTVNVALIHAGRPVLGVVLAPALDTMYAAAGPATASIESGDTGRRPIAARAVPANGAVLVSSRSHGDPDSLAELTANLVVTDHRIAGSSLKFCLVATGEADIYPRYGPTHEWDTAAGHAVLTAAGGSVRTLDGEDLLYGKEKFLNPRFIARGLD